MMRCNDLPISGIAIRRVWSVPTKHSDLSLNLFQLGSEGDIVEQGNVKDITVVQGETSDRVWMMLSRNAGMVLRADEGCRLGCGNSAGGSTQCAIIGVSFVDRRHSRRRAAMGRLSVVSHVEELVQKDR
jgi:hypothetical protein